MNNNGTIIKNPITSYTWKWDKKKNPLDFGFKYDPTENEYIKRYSLWKDRGITTIYANFTISNDEENNKEIDIDVREENGNTYGLFYRSTKEPIAQELSNKLLDILRSLNAHAVEATFYTTK